MSLSPGDAVPVGLVYQFQSFQGLEVSCAFPFPHDHLPRHCTAQLLRCYAGPTLGPGQKFVRLYTNRAVACQALRERP